MHLHLLCTLGLVCLTSVSIYTSAQSPQSATSQIDFARDIQPIFAKHCLKCHGPEKQRGGLRLDDGEAARQGGNSGPVVSPGDLKSRLLVVVSGGDPELKMPPTGPALTVAEIKLLKTWIEQGAKWPRTAAGTSTVVASKHWAFQPPRRTSPSANDSGWIRNPIDAFILCRLEAQAIKPSPDADRTTLIRRLYLDLLGLPPEPSRVMAFVGDTRPDAYELLVEELLASPHYGERWGRHWLDLARYADSDGFEKDSGRPHAWRYRAWVIDAFNGDLPFDQFTIEQLAGDLLPNATQGQKIATGFHRNTLTNKEGGVDKEQYRVEQVVDRVNTTAKVFLGLTMGCAQCHDHKYDPISQREYYQLFAFFNRDVEVDLPAPLPDEMPRYQARKAAFDRKHNELQSAVKAYEKTELPGRLKKWEAEQAGAKNGILPEAVSKALQIDPAKRTPRERKVLLDHHARQDKQLVALKKAVADHQKTEPTLSQAQTLALGPIRKTNLMIRGDFLRPRIEVHPGTPRSLPKLAAQGEATRLDLARWITDPGNPLTSRVIVNWMWSRFFGRGLVATLEDFGTQGEKPSHLDLLDWLATEFIRQGWSTKSIHRLIVGSAAYRQRSYTRPELWSRDPLNTLLARQNRMRLEAEALRDASLAAGGLLAHRIGGPSVRPPQPAGISDLTYAGSARWAESRGVDRHRRGMYTWFQRTSPYPMLLTFDAPDSNTCCVRRDRTNSPLQALTLLNDTVFLECVRALAARVLLECKGDDEARIRYAVQLCLGRSPAVAEMAVFRQLLQDARHVYRNDPPAALSLMGKSTAAIDLGESAAYAVLARALMNLDEFVTRE